MKLKLAKFRHPRMKSLVMLNPNGGAFKWSSIGESLDVDDEIAFKILAECGDMLEIVDSLPPLNRKADLVGDSSIPSDRAIPARIGSRSARKQPAP